MLIDHDAIVCGQIVVAGDVRLDGRCEGSICCWRLEVGRWGRIEGHIEAEEVLVEGEVIGDIRARVVRLAATSVVEGDITHGSLVVDGRAVLVGDSHRDEGVRAPMAVCHLRARAAREDAELARQQQAGARRASFAVGRITALPQAIE